MKELQDWPVEQSTGAVVFGRDWQTPLTETAKAGLQVGNARLIAEPYGRGYYPMEGAYGVQLYKVSQRIPVACLQRRGRDRLWRTWMVDDPLHWYAMQERVRAMPPGRIVCAGLGLGLMLWHLIERDDIESVKVIELDADVIDLMQSLIPDDSRIEVEQRDYYRWLQDSPDKPDAILWDLAVGDKDDTIGDLARGLVYSKAMLPDVPLFRFGIKRVEGE